MPTRKQKCCKTQLGVLKMRLRAYRPSNAIGYVLMIGSGFTNGPKIIIKSLPKQFKGVLEGALSEDRVSNPKQGAAKSIEGATREPRVAPNYKGLGP